jgi:bifunctional oligoribonuclease and PAP phosphatase NrnA
MLQIIKSEILSRPEPFLLVTHCDPDFDAVGSCIGLQSGLTNIGKSSQIWIPDELPQGSHCLGETHLISTQLPDTYSTVIFLDAASEGRIRHFEMIDRDKFWINIDHHQDNTLFGDSNWVSKASSVSEMITSLLAVSGWTISTSAANWLYAGIFFDTGGFQHSNVSHETFDATSLLLKFGANPNEISEKLFSPMPLAALYAVQNGLQNLEIDAEAGLAITWIPKSHGEYGYSVVDFIRRLEGIDVVAVFREVEANLTKVNLRSKTEFSVATIAAQFGGGGHHKAAGISLHLPLLDARNQVTAVLKKELRNARISAG